jgi:hypothetical protein
VFILFIFYLCFSLFSLIYRLIFSFLFSFLFQFLDISGADSAVKRSACGRTHCRLFQDVRASACEHLAHLRTSTSRICVHSSRICVRAWTPDRDAVLFCGRTHLSCGQMHLRKNCHILAAVRTNMLSCARAHLCLLHQHTRRQYVLFLNSVNFN